MKKLIQISVLSLISALPMGCSNALNPAAPAPSIGVPQGPAISAQWTLGMTNPRGVAVGPSGEIFVTDGNSVLKFTSTTQVPTAFTAGAAGSFNSPFGMAAVSDGLYVADSGNARIQKISFQGASMSVPTAYANQGFVYPMGVGMGPDSNLYVTDIVNTVWKIDGTTGAASFGASGGPLAGQFSYPIGVAFLNSDVYVADYQANKVVRFDPGTGSWSSWGGTGTDAGMFIHPMDIKTSAQGKVYVSDSANGRIQEFDANGNFLRQWGNSGSQGLINPMGMAVQGNSLYVVDSGNDRVVMYDLGAP